MHKRLLGGAQRCSSAFGRGVQQLTLPPPLLPSRIAASRTSARRRRACMTVQNVASPNAPEAGYAAGLTAQQLHDFHRDGFLALPGFIDAPTIASMMATAAALVERWDPESQLAVFTTTEDQPHAKDAYFLDSCSNISYFLEAGALKPDGRALAVPKTRALNKIGHALHELEPAFSSFAASPAVSALLRSLGFARPLPVQSMYIFKQPGIGGEVTPHQDSSFLTTTPLSCVGLWLALEDARKHNGCLWAQPRVHAAGLARRLCRQQGGGVGFDSPAPVYDPANFVPIECDAGTLVLLHGENVHYSDANTSPDSRHSWSMHVVEGAPGYEWAHDNWAQRPADRPWVPLYDDTPLGATGYRGGGARRGSEPPSGAAATAAAAATGH